MLICRIVGDNWDLEVKARCQTKSQTNKSLHYFHAYAVKDRVTSKELDNSRPQKSIDDLEMQEILPTAHVQEAIISDLAYIIPRVLVQHLLPYKAFRKAVLYHIPHPYSKEMAEKSEVVSFQKHKIILSKINSGKRTEWSLIPSVIIRVITKSIC